MPSENVICTTCGLANDYRIEVKAHNHVAYCNGCGRYIKNIPYATEPTFYFGRYKGMKVSDLIDKKDRPYLEWFLKEVKDIKPAMKEAIIKQIYILKDEH